jgi:hypothetical protein
VEGSVGELVLERLSLGEVLEHQPHLKQSPGLVSDGEDESPEPARSRPVRLRLAEQQRCGQLALVPGLFEVGGEPHGAQPLALEGVGRLRGGVLCRGPQSVPRVVHQQVTPVGIEDGRGQRGLLYGRP